LIAEYGEAMKTHLIELAEDAGVTYSKIEREAMQLGKKAVKSRRNGVALSIEKLKASHPSIQSELLFQAMEKLRGHRRALSRSHIQEILSLTAGRDRTLECLPQGLKARRLNRHILLTSV
jgi:hypothetical protein